MAQKLTQMSSVILNDDIPAVKDAYMEPSEERVVENKADYSGIKSRWWMVTILNPSHDEIEALKSIKFKYVIWQLEECPETGTPHIHACLYYTNAVVWPKRFLPRARIDKVRSPKLCIEYCSKEESRIDGPWELGEKPEQGRRNDLEMAAKMYLEVGEKEFAEEEPGIFVKHYKGLRELKSISMDTHRDPNKPPTVIWLWGLAGTGKTRTAIEAHWDYYIKDGTRWWDGYEHQQAIIIDDFDGEWPYRDLLRLLDRYPYQGQVKGGYKKINSPYIYITCEYEPKHFWSGNTLAQVTRRITEIRLLGEKPCEEPERF